MRHPSRLGLALAVIAFCLGQIHAAKYGEACSNDADCTDEGAPYCFVYFQDLSPIGQEAVPVSTGKCVECREDCNCGINRYCGIPDSDDGDYLTYDGGFTSSNAGFGKWSETNVNKVAALKEAFSGMPMPSKCMKYKEGDDQDKFCIMHNDFSNQGFYIARTYTRDDDDVTQQGTVTAAAQSWPEALKDRYCGKIDSWVPNFRGFKSFNTVGSSGTTSDTDIDPTNAKTDHELLGTGSPSSPGRCAKKVYYDECVYAVAAKTALNDKCVGAAQTTGTLSFTNCPTGVSHYPTFDNLGSDGMTCVVLETNAAGDTMGTYREDHPEDRATIKAKLDLCYQITTPCSKSRMDLDTTLGGDLQMGWSQDMCSNSGMWQAKVNEVYYMNIWSPATAWTGSCERTKCKVCRNADTMCQDPKRTCVNNQVTFHLSGLPEPHQLAQ
mmetsp:Transcript_1018/g.1708  ORF Transcript_1018/g.1708 Transcript_1018/m.1708 type:complete len:438 (+) Transcript_1018:182-1495(+)